MKNEKSLNRSQEPATVQIQEELQFSLQTHVSS